MKLKSKAYEEYQRKAEEYGFQNPDIHYDADGNTYDDVDKLSIDFEAGANYVLDEIEKLAKTTISDGGTYHYNLYIGLVDLLEQLKK